jgi:hypothetical protein
MIQIKPVKTADLNCDCGGVYHFSEYLWQGLHICEKLNCVRCNKTIINSLPVNQAGLEQYTFSPDSDTISDIAGNQVAENWYSSKLRSFAHPITENVELEIEIISKSDEVLILNTVDYIYGHSLLFLLNLQRIIRTEKNLGIIVIIQPMLRWLLPKHGIAEIWTVKLGFKNISSFYPDLSNKINSELSRFKKVLLSKGYVLPTNENIEMEKFSGIKPYDFRNAHDKIRITFIWREDADRIWIRNIFLLKGFKKLGLSKLLFPIQYLRVVFLLKMLKKNLKNNIILTVAGLGKYGKMPSFIDDQRILDFNEENERKLCCVYSESVLVIGVHGSSMILPSAHAGMAISLMPSKRWGNFAEDILFVESDIRLASFQRRVIPLNLCIYDICEIAFDMITGRDYFIKKFIHNNEL